MDDSWNYIDKLCLVCGGKVKHYFDKDVCENCHYVLPSHSNQAVLYNINSSGSGIAYGGIDPKDLISNTLIIDNCKLIKMHHKELDIDFEFDMEKIKNIDIIELNGHKFVREKNTND